MVATVVAVKNVTCSNMTICSKQLAAGETSVGSTPHRAIALGSIFAYLEISPKFAKSTKLPTIPQNLFIFSEMVASISRIQTKVRRNDRPHLIGMGGQLGSEYVHFPAENGNAG